MCSSKNNISPCTAQLVLEDVWYTKKKEKELTNSKMYIYTCTHALLSPPPNSTIMYDVVSLPRQQKSVQSYQRLFTCTCMYSNCKASIYWYQWKLQIYNHSETSSKIYSLYLLMYVCLVLLYIYAMFHYQLWLQILSVVLLSYTPHNNCKEVAVSAFIRHHNRMHACCLCPHIIHNIHDKGVTADGKFVSDASLRIGTNEMYVTGIRFWMDVHCFLWLIYFASLTTINCVHLMIVLMS